MCQKPPKQRYFSITKKQSHLCNCLILNVIRLGLSLCEAFSQSLRHGRSYMAVHDAPGSARPFLCRNFHSVSKLPSCQSPVQKTPDHPVRRIMSHVIRLGFEPKTHSLEGCCSIQLSYRTGLYLCSFAMGAKVGAKIVFFI